MLFESIEDTALVRPSGVRLRETRTATVEVQIGGRRWRAELDGPLMGSCVVISWVADVGWRMWGTAVWVDEQLQHQTARVVDPAVTAELSEALRKALGSR